MGNFDYLLADKDYESFAHACIEAEQAVAFSTIATAITTRRALELAVKWVYQFDTDLRVPYRDNLRSLVNHYEFKDIIDPGLGSLINYIIKNGNVAAHTHVTISREDAVLGLKNLFEFIDWLDYCYGENYVERTFDEELLPQVADLKVKEPAQVTRELVDKVTQSEQQDRPLEELQAALPADKKEKYTQNRKQSTQPEHYTFHVDEALEAETRARFIDVSLRLAGWDLERDVDIEREVSPMPNTANTGYVDYVLNGRDGLPLAIIEAKRTKRDPKEGRQQALLYAEALEGMTGRYPIVYYTNGFETWMIQDDYPARQVSGFYSQDELQRLIDRRYLKKRPTEMPINDAISGRYYQKAAIQATTEEFERNQRRALLVMATGSGKTRTAISLVDVLTQANWVKNVLFLADRTSLVKQAFRSFNNLLPDLSLCNLLERGGANGADPLTSRMVFSTYPTMLNAIDSLKDQDERGFTVGHFDLIIIDEAHRSIYQRYQAIFDYFDGLVVGLTATPRDDVDKNTYGFFGLEEGNPTYAYDLDEAVANGYLVPYRTIETTLKLPSEGLHYDELSPEEQREFEEQFGEEFTDIDGDAINNWLFNQSTVDIVLHDLMAKGLRTSTGDEIGKTIVFAKNRRHAQLIKERFDALYPEKGPRYMEVIDYSVNYAQDLIDKFSDAEQFPQIAVSVDMLDTGIDVPEVVNLVFFKKVRSKVKFWQMIGRGTRLCPDLYGPGQDKEYFVIFDYAGNFDFFRADQPVQEARNVLSLTHRLFNIRVDLVRELQQLDYQVEPYSAYRQQLVSQLVHEINQLNEESFLVRQQLKAVVQYKQLSAWESIGLVESTEIKQAIGPILAATDDDELAKRFDLLLFTIELAALTHDNASVPIARVIRTAAQLNELGTIPQVMAARDHIVQAMDPDYWTDAELADMEQIRLVLRELVRFIERESQATYYTNFADEVLHVAEAEAPLLKVNDLRNYREKVEHYIQTHLDHTAVYKLRHNQPLTDKDLDGLEQVLWRELGTREQYAEYFGDKTVPRLVREIAGMDTASVNAVFSDLLSDKGFNSRQIAFVRLIIDYVAQNGYLDKAKLMEDPFKSMGGITVLFQDKRDEMRTIIQRIDALNEMVQ